MGIQGYFEFLLDAWFELPLLKQLWVIIYIPGQFHALHWSEMALTMLMMYTCLLVIQDSIVSEGFETR